MRARFATLVRISAVAAALAACGEVKPPLIDGGPDAPQDIDAAVDAAIDAVDAIPIDAPPGTVAIAVVKGGTGMGTITSSVGGIDCGPTCMASVVPGTLVTFQATAATGSDFAGWGSGASTCGVALTCPLFISANTAIGATFNTQRHTVTINASGLGRVTSMPSGIDCPGTCVVTVNHGATMSLAAVAQTGSTFLGWSGGGCSGTGACNLTVTGPTSVNAPFAVQSTTLVVTRGGNGSGTVTGTGINCGSDCMETYPAGTMVTLTAAPAADSVFSGWTGACTNLTGTCTVTVNAATTVNANFTLRQFTLTVTRGGAGTGTVTGPGVSCGTDCNEPYNAGTMVTLQAVPAMDNTFTGWSGDCAGTTTTCTVTMSQARNVIARFDPAGNVTLTLSVYGGGRLDSSVMPISGPPSCSSTNGNTTICSLVFPIDTTVMLRAVPQLGFQLIEIFGCTLSGSECTTTLTSSQTVTVYYCQPSGVCPL